MRVPKERIAARARISELEYRFEKAMLEGDDYFEIETALANVLSRIKNIQLLEIYPIVEEEVKDEVLESQNKRD